MWVLLLLKRKDDRSRTGRDAYDLGIGIQARVWGFRVFGLGIWVQAKVQGLGLGCRVSGFLV